ncbi:uncharacterized protein LOC124355905 [Homalodisca vitripennis]|uniref:uncharacterized protein LOC124355905 n=1 Tax=Homalodisca vitripennis TaxID=197043 RepID=UPI001EECCB87|nr:uncharacterized protein LOC124355905 [Homalodisca vitripennis]
MPSRSTIQVSAKVVSASEEVCFEDVFEGPLLKNLIIDHLKNLKEEFSRYFPNLSEELYKLSTDPFNMDIQLLPEELQEEGIEIKMTLQQDTILTKWDKPSFWLNWRVGRIERWGRAGGGQYVCDTRHGAFLSRHFAPVSRANFSSHPATLSGRDICQ